MSETMTNSELVQLARDLRAAGVMRMKHGDIELDFLPPEAPKLTQLAAAMGELPLNERQDLIEQAKKDLDADLYGASG